jgi:hypothetical protein
MMPEGGGKPEDDNRWKWVKTGRIAPKKLSHSTLMVVVRGQEGMIVAKLQFIQA